MPSDTRTQLLMEADAIVRRHGYAGFSYAQIAAAVGIRKPSIHHHFPSKEDLGAALIDACCAEFGDKLEAIAAASPDAPTRLARYAGLYRDTLQNGVGCLCGVLASEIDLLPERIRAGVRRFMHLNIAWLERVMGEARETGALAVGLDIPAQARLVLATLQGALLTARALGTDEPFELAVAALTRSFGWESPPCH